MLNLKTLLIFVALIISSCSFLKNQPNTVLERHNKNTEATVLGVEKIGDLPRLQTDCSAAFQYLNQQAAFLVADNELWNTVDGGNTWNHIYNFETSFTLTFINSRVAWGNSLHEVIKTEDGGITWKKIKIPTELEQGVITSVKFSNNNQQGWITGGLYKTLPRFIQKNGGMKKPYYGTGVRGLYGAIFYTNDGGMNWTQQFLPSAPGSLISKIDILDFHHVWAIGDNDLFYFDGANWRKIDFPKGSCPNDQLREAVGAGTSSRRDIFDIAEINFISLDVGWITTSNGVLAKTTDNGKTWCDVFDSEMIKEDKNERANFIKLYFFDNKRGVALTRSGKIYSTFDNGLSWKKISSNITFCDIYFIDIDYGWGLAKEGIFRINI